jgi:uncharacterized SAM-binding protein YcdF (DUF218 family)
MYYINKIVGWATSPLGLAFIGLCAGWLLRLGTDVKSLLQHRASERWYLAFRRRIGAWLIWLTIVMLWFTSTNFATKFLGVGLERRWEREGLMHGSIEGLPDCNAIVVLGGGVGGHEKCHAPELFSGADRVWQGARLYNMKKNSVPDLKVFCTGGGCADAALPLLIDLGVPREAIWFSEEPRNTEEEASLIKEQIAGEWPRILLVTSAWHMTRSKTLFERAGFEVIAAPTDFEMNCAAEKHIEFADFIPSAEALLRNSYAVKEWVAQFGYRLLK